MNLSAASAASVDEPSIVYSVDVDAVLSRIRTIVAHSLGVNAAQWLHFSCDAAHLIRTREWIDNLRPNASMLLFYVLPNATLHVAGFLPSKRPAITKATYLLKTGAVKVTKTNFEKVVIRGDMPANLIAFTAAILPLFASLLCNRRTRRGWPEDTCSDIDANLQRVMRQTADVADKQRSQQRGLMCGGAAFQMAEESSKAVATVVQEFLENDGKVSEDFTETARPMVEKHVIEMCIDLERSLKRNRPAKTSSSEWRTWRLIDECSEWQTRWNNLLEINEHLRKQNATALCEILGAFGSNAYLNSLQTILDMVHAESEQTVQIVAFLKALTQQLRPIQHTSLPEMLDTVAPTMRCCARLFACNDSEIFKAPTDGMRIVAAVCNEFIAEIRGHLDMVGSVLQQSHPADVTRFVLAEQILKSLRASLRADELHLNAATATSALHEIVPLLDGFTKRVEQVRQTLETAIDFHQIEKLALIGAAGAGSGASCRLLHVVDVYRRSLVKYWVNNAADMWEVSATTCGDFEQRLREHRTNVADLNQSVEEGFAHLMKNCRTVRHCKQMLHFIDDLFYTDLRQKLKSECCSRMNTVLRLEITEITTGIDQIITQSSSPFDTNCQSLRVDGFLQYPAVASTLLTLRAYRLRLHALHIDEDADDCPTELIISVRVLLERLDHFEDDTVQQFLVAYQHFELTQRHDEMLINVLAIARLNLDTGSELQVFLRNMLSVACEKSDAVIKS